MDFKAYFACVPLGILTKFSVNPYYEPLSRFMINNLADVISNYLFNMRKVLGKLNRFTTTI